MKEIGEIELSIQGGTEEIEALGEAGKVEESMEKLSAVEALKGLKGEKEKELQNLNETAGASGHQKLRVCETCVCPFILSACSLPSPPRISMDGRVGEWSEYGKKETDDQGAMLSVLDSDKRLADHFGGKVRPYFWAKVENPEADEPDALGIPRTT